MKKILFVHHVSEIGGASYCLLNIIKGLDFNNIEPIILLARKGPIINELEKFNVKYYLFNELLTVPYNLSLLKRGTLSTYFKVFQSCNSFSKLLDEIPVDAVYFNNVMLYPYLKVTANKGIKSFIHIREHWPKHSHMLQFSLLKKYVRKYADDVVAINEYSAHMISGIQHKVTKIYDWIDFKDRYEEISFSNIFDEDATKLKVFLFTGGRSPIKGATEVVDVFHNLIHDSDCRLLVLGADLNIESKGLVGMCKNLLHKIGINTYAYKFINIVKSDNRIKCLPSTYAIKHYLEQSYCMLSYYTIPHANLALAEAIVSGLVCVAAETPESIEYSNHSDGAVLFKFKSKKAFKNAIVSVMNNYDYYEDKVKLNAAYVKAIFDKDINCKKLNELLVK